MKFWVVSTIRRIGCKYTEHPASSVNVCVCVCACVCVRVSGLKRYIVTYTNYPQIHIVILSVCRGTAPTVLETQPKTN